MRTAALVCCLLTATGTLTAQENDRTNAKTKVVESANTVQAPVHYYRLDFVVEELGADDKPVNSRSYSTTVNTGERSGGATVKTGTRVPVTTSGPATNAEGEKKMEVQYQYIDVGVSITANDAREVGGQLSLFLNADVSSLASPTGLSTPSAPVIRQNSWRAMLLIPILKRTVAFKSDALDTKGGMQLLVTATPLQ